MSNFRLLEVPQAIEDAIDNMIDPETGEILSEDEVLKICEELEGERIKKIEWLAKMVVNKNAEIDALSNHKRDIDKRLKAAKSSVESLKTFIRLALQGEKYKAEDGSVSISYRNTKDVVLVDELTAIPDMYFKTPHTESNLNKTLIKEAISMGSLVPGAHLEDTVSTIIK